MIEDDKKWYKIVSTKPDTIEILFLETQTKKEYRIVTVDQIREKVNKGENICLDNCYVKDFSYEKISNHKSELNGFHAYNTFFDGKVSFSGARFSDGDVSFKNAIFGDGDVGFEKAVFGKGNKNFAGARFGNGNLSFRFTEFGTGNVCFRDVNFQDGDVSFFETKYGKGHIDFVSAQFGIGKVDFSFSEFGEGDVYFAYTHFGKGRKDFEGIKKGEGITSFVYSDFSDGDVEFSGSDFGDGQVVFWKAKFGIGAIDFSGVRFGGKTETFELVEPNTGVVQFNDVQFGKGDVDFSYSEFGNGIVDFSCSKFSNGNVKFDNAVFGDRKIMFRGAIISDGDLTFCKTNFGKGNISFDNISSNNTTVRFEDCILNSAISLDQCDISKLVFSNCTNHDMINFGKQSQRLIQMIAFFYHNNMGTILLNWDIYKNSILTFQDSIMSENIDGKEVDLSKTMIISELKMLKENYHNQGEYWWEDDAYVHFKRLETKQLSKKNPKRRILSFLGMVGKYGTDPWSVFVFMIVAVVVFGLLYLLPWMSIYPEKATRHIWSPFYYSLITFLTIGYGDLSAQNWQTALICGIEGFLGVFMMSYFSVAVVRKILR